MCSDLPHQKIVEFTVVPKTFSLPQVLDITLITPIPLGNQLTVKAVIVFLICTKFKSV